MRAHCVTGKPKSLWHTLNHLTFESLKQGLNHWNLRSWQPLSDGYFSVFSILKKKRKGKGKKVTQNPVWGGQTFLLVYPSLWGWEEIRWSSPEEVSEHRPALLRSLGCSRFVDSPILGGIPFPSWSHPSTCGVLQENSPPAHSISSLHSLLSLASALRKFADTQEIIMVMGEMNAGMQESQMESPAQGRGARQSFKGVTGLRGTIESTSQLLMLPTVWRKLW